MIKLLIALIILTACGLSVGQGHAAAGWPFQTSLLRYVSVQRELALSPATVKKIAGVRSAADKRYLSMISPSPSNPNVPRALTYAQRAEEARKTDEAILSLLSSRQKSRLMEIGVQYAGAYGLMDRKLGQSIGITADQDRQLREAAVKRNKSFSDAMSAAVGNGHLSGSNPRMAEQKLAAAQVARMRALESDLVKILTHRQLRLWKQMQGKPFPIEQLYAPVKARVLNARS